MCFRALCTILETDILEIGTVAAGSVSLDKAQLMSLFSAEEKTEVFTYHIKYLPTDFSYCINCVFVCCISERTSPFRVVVIGGFMQKFHKLVKESSRPHVLEYGVLSDKIDGNSHSFAC